MSTVNERPFKEVVTFEQFRASKGVKANNFAIAKTNNGAIVLTCMGSPVATISNKLKGADHIETANNIAAVNVCFGIPHDGAKDSSGTRDALPCLMESTSQWESASIW